MSVKITELVKSDHMKRFHDTMVRFNGRYIDNPVEVTYKNTEGDQKYYVNVFFPTGEEYNNFIAEYNRSINKIVEKDETVTVKMKPKLVTDDDEPTSIRKRQASALDRLKKIFSSS